MKLKQKLAINYLRTKFKLLAQISKTKTADQVFTLFCTPLLKASSKPRIVFTWAEEVNFILNGLKVYGYRWNKEAAYKVLILHGFGSSANNFHYYIEAMLEKGYQVLAFDAPAHGKSQGKTVNVLEYSQLIQKIILQYGPIDGYIAHSFGGIALSLALEKTPHDHHTKIVLIAPATETSTAIDSAFELLQINDKAVRAAFDSIIFQKSGYPVNWYSIKRAMKNIQASVLWIHDEDDDVTPLSDALKVKEAGFKNIEFIITSGLGHRNIYRDKSVQKKVTQFL